MRVDALAVKLRPRPMAEAADLGVLLVRTHARSIWLTWGPVFAAALLVSLATIEIAPWLPALLIFWLKPWLDRSLLFVLSRAVFGQETRFIDLWSSRGTVWWAELLRTLTLRRLSPWRSFTQPIYQLEGQRGKERRKRRSQLLRAKRGAAGAMHLVFAHVEFALGMGAMAVLVLFAPEGTHRHMLQWLFDGQAQGNALFVAAIYGAVVLALEPFYVAAGFSMYLNRRVELEAWDVEQEFRLAFGS